MKKAKYSAILYLVLGLAVTGIGFAGLATAQDRIKNNHDANQDDKAIPDTLTAKQPSKVEAGPQAMPAGGSFFNGTCYSSPLVIPAAAFSSDGDAEGTYYFWFSGGYVSGTGTYGCIKAPAYLPNGATVTEVYASVYDNDGTDNLWIDLMRVNRLDGVTDTMASPATSGSSTDIQQISDTSIVEPLIDYPNYAYYVTTCLPSDMRLYSVRIYFTKE